MCFILQNAWNRRNGLRQAVHQKSLEPAEPAVERPALTVIPSETEAVHPQSLEPTKPAVERPAMKVNPSAASSCWMLLDVQSGHD